eukprot:6459621-Amphidinium_carterae.1
MSNMSCAKPALATPMLCCCERTLTCCWEALPEMKRRGLYLMAEDLQKLISCAKSEASRMCCTT